MKSYVTGSTGFIGRALLKKLQGDIIGIPHDEITSFKCQPFDYYFFLSTYGNLFSHTQGLGVFQANVLEPLHVISQAIRHDFKSFVFISTSSVKLRTQTMYSRSKKASEEILLSFMEKYNKPICIIRPFSITGVGEQKEHLIPTLIDAAYTQKTINFVPWASHDFIDIDDVVDGILSLSQHSARGIFDLGTGMNYTNQEVLELVERITGKSIPVNFVDSLRPYDNKEWRSENFKARGYGWIPKKKLKDSIKEMVEVYEKATE